MSKDMTVAEFRAALKEGRYTSVGSYPKFFLTSDGGVLSFKTAKEEQEEIEDAIRSKSRNGWRVVAVDVNWEDPELYDDHSGERIESAYAEDEHIQPRLPGVRNNPSRSARETAQYHRYRVEIEGAFSKFSVKIDVFGATDAQILKTLVAKKILRPEARTSNVEVVHGPRIRIGSGYADRYIVLEEKRTGKRILQLVLEG